MLTCQDVKKGVKDLYDDQGAYLLEVFGTREQLPEAIRKTAMVEDPSHLDHDDFALVAHNSHGETVCKLPMHDAEHATISAIYLTGQADDLPSPILKSAGARLSRRLRSFGIDLLPEVNDPGEPVLVESVRPELRFTESVKEASTELPKPFPKTAMVPLLRLLGSRKAFVRNPQAYDDATAMLMTKTSAAEVVEVLEDADLRAGMFKRPHYIPDPETVVKIAMDVAQPETRGKHEKSKKLLERITTKRSVLLELVGDEVYKQLLENPVAVLKSLPEAVQQRVRKILQTG